MNEFRFEPVSGSGIADHLDDLARLRIEVFREFPYLYQGDDDYERRYLRTYIQSPRSTCTLVYDGKLLVGATTGLPLVDEIPEVRKPFSDAGYDLAKVFYCGESVLKKSHRDRGIYKHLFRAREDHARSLGGFEIASFCCVQRPPDHPLRPPDYVPLDAIWTRFGYREHPELETDFDWKDIDQPEATKKRMRFWLKLIKEQ